METTALAVIETINAIDLFNPEVIVPKLAAVRTEVMAQAAKLDISTPGNRSELASLAYSVGKMKTFVDKQRLALVGPRKAELKKIDTVGGQNWDFLEALQKEVRKPLTDWEDAERDRVAGHQDQLMGLESVGVWTLQNWQSITAEVLRDRMAEVERDGDQPPGYDWQEFATRAAQVKAFTLKQMGEALAKREAYEAEQAELARLRKEAFERQQKEQFDRTVREATENAERASREREAQALRDKEAAEARAAKAEQDAKDAAERAATQAAEAAQRAERDKAAAVAAEQKRAADAKAAELAEQKAREKDKAHKAEVHNGAVQALMAVTGATEAACKRTITAIAQGKIPGARMVY